MHFNCWHLLFCRGCLFSIYSFCCRSQTRTMKAFSTLYFKCSYCLWYSHILLHNHSLTNSLNKEKTWKSSLLNVALSDLWLLKWTDGRMREFLCFPIFHSLWDSLEIRSSFKRILAGSGGSQRRTRGVWTQRFQLNSSSAWEIRIVTIKTMVIRDWRAGKPEHEFWN